MSALIEPFFLCLFGSMIWAPIVFLFAVRFQPNDAPGVSDKLWPMALLLAGMPALLSPVAASLGLSLRSAPDLPPMADISEPIDYIPASIDAAPLQPADTIALSDILGAAASLYFYGFLLFFALGVARMVWFSCRVQWAYDLDEPRLEAGLEEWRRRMNIKRAPRYAFTDAVSSVCVHGFFRQKILMPMNLLDRVSVEDAVLMGAHEMAHIKRGDTWLFAFAIVMKALFWFNPFVHRIAARANLAAEQAADALVIARGANHRDYAKCFVEGLRFAAGAARPEMALAPSFTPFDKRSRRQRLDAILSKTGTTGGLSLPMKAGMGLSVILAAGLAFAQAAFAVAPNPPKEALPVTPVEGDVTFGFGATSSVLGPDRPTHEGVDIRAERGTVVHAAGAGKVIAATKRYKGQTAWGNVVVIDHGNGLVTRYAHLDSYIVHKGDSVKAGAAIGAVGSTGKVTGPHLHFEVLQDGVPIDPTPVIAATAPMSPPVIRASNVRSPARAPRSERTPKIANAPAPVAAVSPAPPTAAAVAPVAAHPAQPAAAPTALAPASSVLAAAPDAPEAPSLAEKIDRRLVGKIGGINKKFKNSFKDFDAYASDHHIEIDISDLELDKLGDAISDAMDGADIEFNDINDINVDLPQLASLDANFEWSDEDREELRRARDEAVREARDAMREAQQEMARAQKERERAVREAQRDMEEAQRELQRNLQEAEQERQEALEEVDRARQEALAEAEAARQEALQEQREAQEEILADREEALREAQEEIENERAEIERLRAELEEKLRQIGEND